MVLGVIFAYRTITNNDITQVSDDSQFVTYIPPNLNEDVLVSIKSEVDKLERQLKDLPDDPSDKYNLYLGLAQNYLTLGELSKSRDAYIWAADLFPKDANIRYSLSQVYLQMKDYDNVVRYIDEAIALEPIEVEFWRFKLTYAEQQLGISEGELREMYEEAIESTQRNVDMVTFYAAYLSRVGDLENSVAQWKFAKQLYPGGAEIFDREIQKIQDRVR